MMQITAKYVIRFIEGVVAQIKLHRDEPTALDRPLVMPTMVPTWIVVSRLCWGSSGPSPIRISARF